MTEYACYENLANAIVAAAAKDYRKALKVLKANPDNAAARYSKRVAREFFFSSWFEILTDLDPVALVERLDKEVEE